MKYSEEDRDLFLVDEKYHLAHCISADAAMGAGIAVPMKRTFGLHQVRQMAKANDLKVGTCVKDGRVLNLITKQHYWLKPTYETFRQSIEDMKRIAEEENVKHIAMPLIGAGIDRLNWTKNSEIIKEVFESTDVEILVCRLKK